MKNITLILAGLLPVAITLLVLQTQQTNAQLCPLCTCPPTYSPVCGYRPDTGEEQLFNSRCVLKCNNKCLENKFVLKKKGSCLPKPKKEENETFEKNDGADPQDNLKASQVSIQ